MERKDLMGAKPRDPLELWVGVWMPEDVIDREARQLKRESTSAREQGLAEKET